MYIATFILWFIVMSIIAATKGDTSGIEVIASVIGGILAIAAIGLWGIGAFTVILVLVCLFAALSNNGSSKGGGDDLVRNDQSDSFIDSSDDREYSQVNEKSIIIFKNVDRVIAGQNGNSCKKHLKISWLFIVYIIAATLLLIHNNDMHSEYPKYVEFYGMKIFIPFIALPIAMRLIYRIWYVNSSSYKYKFDLHIGWTVTLFYVGLMIILGGSNGAYVVLGVIIILIDAIWFISQVIAYNTISNPKIIEENRKAKRQSEEEIEKEDLIRLGVIAVVVTLVVSAIVIMNGKNSVYDPEDVIQEFFDTYEEDYEYTVGEVESEKDTYRELADIATWYYGRYQYLDSWSGRGSDFFSKRNIKSSDYSGPVREEVKRKHKELEDIMVGYVSELIDKSDKKFKDRKVEIIEQMKGGAYYLANAKSNVSRERYEEVFDYAIQFGKQPKDNIVVETMNELYPTEMKRGCNAYIKTAEKRSLDSQVSMLRYVKRYYIGIGKEDANLNSKIDMLAKELRKQSNSANSNSNSSSNSSSSSSHSSGSSSSSSGKKTESTTVDPMDHDIDLYYEDYKDEFEDEDDAWDDFEDNDEYWDDY